MGDVKEKVARLVEFLHDEDMILTAEASSFNSQKKRFVRVFEKKKVDQLREQCKEEIVIIKGKLNMKSHIDPACLHPESTVLGPFKLRQLSSRVDASASKTFENIKEAAAFLECTEANFLSALVDGSEVTHNRGETWWRIDYAQHRIKQSDDDRSILNDALSAQHRWLAELEAGLNHNKANKVTGKQNANNKASVSDPVLVGLPQAKREVKYVITIDDLDRCTDGKAIKVLSALQLFFNEVAPPVEDAVEVVSTCCSYNVDAPYSKLTSITSCCTWVAGMLTSCCKCCSSTPGKLEADREGFLNDKLEDLLETGTVERKQDWAIDEKERGKAKSQMQKKKQKMHEVRKSSASEKPPFLVFLMIDPRIVVQEVETHFGSSLAKAGINGYDFLDKIIQTPFCKFVL